MSKIGIILVNYNGLADTVSCINSINRSTYKDYSIYVVDNNSSDDVDGLSALSNVILKRLDQNLGFGIANNIGAELAASDGCDYIFCLNNDTEISEGLLSLFVKEIGTNEVLTCATYYYSDKQELWYGGGTVSRIRGVFRQKQYKTDRNVSFICGCCMFFSVETFRNIGLFAPEYFMYCEDSDFSIKLKLNGFKIRYLVEECVYHKVGKSISKEPGMKEYYLTRNRLYLMKKYKGYFYPSAWIYFYITFFIKIVISFLCGNSPKPYIVGYKDFKKGKMEKKQ